jgi:ribosome-associated translation inhibitor RaiA
MSELDFHIDYYIEDIELEDDLLDEIDAELRQMGEDHRDMVGAAVTVEEIAGVEDPFLFQARVVAYVRPKNLNAIEKAGAPDVALKRALDALQRQLQKYRSKLKEPWEHPAQLDNQSVYELTPAEIYASFIEDRTPQEVMDQGRTSIASRLMVEEKLSEEAAYFAADRILEVAEREISGAQIPE